jgi:hypothetical protein
MDYETAWTYCCSIGKKPLEFPDGNYPEMWAKLVNGFNIFIRFIFNVNAIFLQAFPIYSYTYRHMYIGETEAFNGTHERWCQSKELISIAPLYGWDLKTR